MLLTSRNCYRMKPDTSWEASVHRPTSRATTLPVSYSKDSHHALAVSQVSQYPLALQSWLSPQFPVLYTKERHQFPAT